MTEQLTLEAPSWAKAVIVAELHEDASDSMTDYFHHTIKRTLILAWSKHDRKLFPEMRKAAARAPETEHLGPGKGAYRADVVLLTDIPNANGTAYWAGQRSPWHRDIQPEWGQLWTTAAEAEAWIAEKGPPHEIQFGSIVGKFVWRIVGALKTIEHRENYSMGGGYYLKAGHRHSDGWCVRKQLLWRERTVLGEDRINHAAPEQAVQFGEDGMIVRPGLKAGFSEVLFPERPDDKVLSALKRAGYRWSRRNRVWYGKTVNLPAL